VLVEVCSGDRCACQRRQDSDLCAECPRHLGRIVNSFWIGGLGMGFCDGTCG